MFRSSFRYFSKTSSSKTSGQTTVDKEELSKFSSAAKDWWHSSSAVTNFALHSLNAIRVPLVRNALVSRKAALQQKASDTENPASPLRGLTVLDVGCGGGILSEVNASSLLNLDPKC
jgi:2-polyprenyl-3-methyl-5-hydroxy-6-metoxy-1,4-benzoquinol methylase